MAECDFEEAAKHRIIATFRKWDSDGNGSISKDELCRILMNLGMAENKVGAIFKTVDKNNDGAVNYCEFVSWMFGSAAGDLPVDAASKMWRADTLNDVLNAATVGDSAKAINLIRRDTLIDADASDGQGTTIMMAAAKGGQVALIQSLLEMKASGINAADREGHTALDYAHFAGKLDVIDFMVRRHVAQDNTVVPFIRSLLPAVLRADAEAVRQSVRPRVEFKVYIDRHIGTYHGLTMLPCGSTSLLVKKIEPGLIDDWNKRNPYMQVEVGDQIMEVNEYRGDNKVLSAELAKYQEMHIIVHRYSLELASDPNVSDERGTTALHHAVRSGKPDVLKAILAADRLQINAKDRFGRTASDIATEQGNEELVEMLRENGGKLSEELKE
mmetsp:Transcript_138458/g.386212  ORF Transcript_138458/g.386212 Transcript_138458/m.386212 type:complete len:385 (-) Transcript_138458:40-1194(-)